MNPPINCLPNRQKKKKAETFWTLLEHIVYNTETKTPDHELRTLLCFLEYSFMAFINLEKL